MKLRYKIAQSTALNSETIIKNILSKLRDEKYGVLEITPTSVSFDDDDGRILVGNWEYARRVKNGWFEIIKNNDSHIVTLSFLPISISEYIWVGLICLAPIVFGFINHEYWIGFMSWPFIGQLVFKHYNLQSKAKKMLNYVSGVDFLM
jgi:hypothetical protein